MKYERELDYTDLHGEDAHIRDVPTTSIIKRGRHGGPISERCNADNLHQLNRLTEEQVCAVAARLREGGQHRTIAREFGVSKSCITSLHKRKRWGNLTLETDAPKRVLFAERKFGFDLGCYSRNGKLATIAKLLVAGLSNHATARETGASRVTIRRVRHALEVSGATLRCECGQNAKHQGWCSVRYANSWARQAVLERLQARAPARTEEAK